LKKNGRLRGCIGSLLPIDSLYKCVMKNAVNAAVNDIRFPPVRYEELNDITIEISVLTLPRTLKFENHTDLLSKLSEADGVIIELEGRSATYLPQVWEQIPNKEEFLSSLCKKAGLYPNCWKREDIVVKVYNAQVFGESTP